MSKSINPAKPAAKLAKKLKVLIYGDYGTGKTLAALTFPKPVVIDAEGGLDLYAGREGVPDFDVLKTKSLDEVYKLIAFIQEDRGATYETLVIDPITVLYDVQKEAALEALKRAGRKDELTFRDWGKINARMTSLYNTLSNLPVHVVVIAREATLYANDATTMKVEGVKPDVDKRIGYMFDFVIHTRKGKSAEVIKSRGVGLGSELPHLSWDVFAKAAGMFNQGDAVAEALNEDQAVERDARAYADAPAPSKQPDILRRSDKERFAKFIDWAKRTYNMEDYDTMNALLILPYAIREETPREMAQSAVLAYAAGYQSPRVRSLGAKSNQSGIVIAEAVKIAEKHEDDEMNNDGADAAAMTQD